MGGFADHLIGGPQPVSDAYSGRFDGDEFRVELEISCRLQCLLIVRYRDDVPAGLIFQLLREAPDLGLGITEVRVANCE